MARGRDLGAHQRAEPAREDKTLTPAWQNRLQSPMHDTGPPGILPVQWAKISRFSVFHVKCTIWTRKPWPPFFLGLLRLALTSAMRPCTGAHRRCDVCWQRNCCALDDGWPATAVKKRCPRRQCHSQRRAWCRDDGIGAALGRRDWADDRRRAIRGPSYRADVRPVPDPGQATPGAGFPCRVAPTIPMTTFWTACCSVSRSLPPQLTNSYGALATQGSADENAASD